MASSLAQRKRRVPKLCYTDARNIGYYATFRDADSGRPRKHVFGKVPKAEAERVYASWLARHMNDEPELLARARSGDSDGQALAHAPPAVVRASTGSLAMIASDFLDNVIDSRTRGYDLPIAERPRNSIAPHTAETQRRQVRDFLIFMNSLRGHGAVGRLTLYDLQLTDVESYCRMLVGEKGYSQSEVRKRMQIVKRLVDWAGRPEHGGQVLGWNWASLDQLSGRPGRSRMLPTVSQLEKILEASSVREQTMIWMAIGMGFGQSDLAVVRVNQIDQSSYDLRRGKTGVERYGVTPPHVWVHLVKYLREHPRPDGDLLFVTNQDHPLVHGRTNSVNLWWARLRARLGESPSTLDGFYVLRHLGATEFGSRPGCSLSEMRRWLGYSTGSAIADRYMRPVASEHREVIEWVGDTLASTDAPT